MSSLPIFLKQQEKESEHPNLNYRFTPNFRNECEKRGKL